MSAMVCPGETCGSYTQLKAAAIKDFLGGQPETVRSTVLTKLQVITVVHSINGGGWHDADHHALAEAAL